MLESTTRRITLARVIALIKYVLLGIVIEEMGYFSRAIAGQLNYDITQNHSGYPAVIFSIVGIVLVVIYAYKRDFWSDFLKIIKSKRADIFLAIILGLLVSSSFGGIGNAAYLSIASHSSEFQLILLLCAPIFVGFLLLLASIFRSRQKPTEPDFFISDAEKKTENEDLLGFSEQAKRFADRVFNGGSSDSIVFGIDAPWGIGKSTFVNLCIEKWEEQPDCIIIYKFNPLRYEERSHLLEKFIDGLVRSIQKVSFLPEIRPLVSKYSRLLKGKGTFSIFGIRFELYPGDYTIDDAFDDLGDTLADLDKKIIIVVDDLDRLNFSVIKDVLFVIKKCFTLPNISYVLCYDTENITTLEREKVDTDKISEFLEKFVNVKMSLYLNSETLAKYVSENLDKTVSTKLVDPVLVQQAIGGLLDIYRSPSYHKYLPFIGDVRKLKRLINTVVLFELQTTDFKNSDFDKGDLIHLLLIYIHYPNVFRKIYDTETNGRRGFFSLVIWGDDGYPSQARGTSLSDSPYKNSTYYTDYVSELRAKGYNRECFLLDQVFNVDIKLEDARIDQIPEDTRTSLACFNGGWTNGRNLETYLKLIVELSKPENSGQHRFYMSWRDRIIEKSITISEAFADKEFAFDNGEYRQERLWRILVNTGRGLKKDVAASIISYLLDSVPCYSLLELKDEVGIGLRHDLDYFLTRLLNDAGWSDPTGGHSRNTEENISEIAEWVFGDGGHSENGVIKKLSQPSRGVLGFHDLMLFRLSCSADRGGDIFDLSRALAQHAGEKMPAQGDMRIFVSEEMREISQKVFEIFRTQYIESGKNIFDEIAALQMADFAGECIGYLEAKIKDGMVQKSAIDKKVIELKTRVGSFILYQLGNNEISHGVGCGFYDSTGKEDKQEIRRLVNDYLFDICFDPREPKNAEYFIDYLFRNFANALASSREDGLRYIPTINEFTKVLDRQKLTAYWQKNGAAIKALNLHEKEKIVFVGNDEASYKQYVPMVYEVLDNNTESATSKTEASESADTE